MRLQASWRGIRAVSAAPDGQSMDMAVPDDVGTLITSNHTGIVDDIYFLLFHRGAHAKITGPFRPLRTPARTPMRRPTHPKYRTVRAVLKPCGEPRGANVSAHAARRRALPVRTAPRAASTLRAAGRAMP